LEKLFVTGCLVAALQLKIFARRYRKLMNTFGVNSLPEIVARLEAGYVTTPASDRILTGPGHYAYLKVSEGCDKKCAFCAIPLIRGRHISRPIEEILEEAAILSEKGVRELILIAQDLTFYGMDRYGNRSIAELVQKIASANQFDWIRLHYLYPSSFPLPLLPIIRDIPEVCKYIDLPVQHISDRVLKNMARSHSATATRSLLDKIRMEIPEAAIRTTLIVGHPGEDETDFAQLADFVREFRFDRLGVFTYSHEENTPAGTRFDDLIPQEAKEARKAEIMAIQQEISSELNSSMIGRSLPVMIDRREGEWLVGRTEYDSPEIDQEVLIPFTAKIKTGTIIPVRISGSGDFDLFGDPI
jgi:ribosomal protein S12 methylthiotransferase